MLHGFLIPVSIIVSSVWVVMGSEHKNDLYGGFSVKTSATLLASAANGIATSQLGTPGGVCSTLL